MATGPGHLRWRNTIYTEAFGEAQGEEPGRRGDGFPRHLEAQLRRLGDRTFVRWGGGTWRLGDTHGVTNEVKS